MVSRLLENDNFNNIWRSDKLWRNIVLGAVLVKVSSKVVFCALQYVSRKLGDRPPPSVNYERDVVYLHILPRDMGKSVPNTSPFAIKVEMWLRIHNIKHQVSTWGSKRSFVVTQVAH